MKKYYPKHYLVTGGAGFIGANFIRYLLSNYDDIQVVNLDLLTYAGSLKNLEDLPNAKHYQFVQGDICDGDLVSSILKDHQIDTIVHFAAESHVDRSISGPASFIQTNIVGTFTLLEAARKVWLESNRLTQDQCRFHHISTDEVYGSLDAEECAFMETSRYEPNSPYSASKASSDHLVRAYFHTYGLPVTTSNCSNNYGPYQHREKYIPTIISACLENKPIPIYGDGSNIRDWLYVEDHCRGIDSILQRGEIGEVYNIGGNEEHTNLDIAKHICRVMDGRFPQRAPHQRLTSFVKDRLGHDWRYAINSQKIQDDLNWKPQETFADGIEKTVDFYLASIPEDRRQKMEDRVRV